MTQLHPQRRYNNKINKSHQTLNSIMNTSSATSRILINQSTTLRVGKLKVQFGCGNSPEQIREQFKTEHNNT